MRVMQVYDYIRSHPECTRSEIFEGLGIRSSSCWRTVDILERDGWIRGKLEDPSRQAHSTNPKRYKVIK